jgi:hypothetical protein
VPPAPAPIDYDKMAEASIRVAKAQTAEEEAAIRRLYPEYIRMQFGTADQLAGRLDNEYLQRTRGVIGEELQAASAPNAIEAELQRRAQADLMAGPTVADRQIEAAGLSAMGMRADQVQAGQVGAGTLGDTLMGRANQMAQSTGRLSPDAERDAVQAARAGMAARGLATGSAGTAAELLNRDRFARQRQFEDLGFSQQVQGQDLTRQFQNVGNRLAAGQSNQAANQAQLAQNRGFMVDARNAVLATEEARRGQALGASQLDLARRQRRIGLSGMYMETDPYRQALGPAFGLGGDTLRTSQGQVSDIFGNSLTQSGNVASFNTNMLASNRNAALNNNAAMQAAAMQAGASQNAGMMGMFGGIGGGVASGLGSVGMGMALGGVSF